MVSLGVALCAFYRGNLPCCSGWFQIRTILPTTKGVFVSMVIIFLFAYCYSICGPLRGV